MDQVQKYYIDHPNWMVLKTMEVVATSRSTCCKTQRDIIRAVGEDKEDKCHSWRIPSQQRYIKIKHIHSFTWMYLLQLSTYEDPLKIGSHWHEKIVTEIALDIVIWRNSSQDIMEAMAGCIVIIFSKKHTWQSPPLRLTWKEVWRITI